MSKDFWDWLPKTYGEVGDEPVFTKYDMEVAFAAGAENEAKRMWVGLTDEEIASIRFGFLLDNRWYLEDMIRYAEQKIKEKNT